MEPDEGAGGGGIMSGRVMGIPVIVIVAGVAILAYFLFFRNSSGSGASSSAGTGDTQTVGDTTIDTGAVQVTVNAGGSGNTNGQPQPPVGPGTKTVTVPGVVGMRANTAIADLRKAGLKTHSTTGARNPLKTYTVTQETPGKGAKVKRGSVISLAFKQR